MKLLFRKSAHRKTSLSVKTESRSFFRQSDFNIPEPTADTIVKKSKKTGKHRGRKEIRADLETKKVVYELPNDEQICSVCGEPLTEYTEEYITTRLSIMNMNCGNTNVVPSRY